MLKRAQRQEKRCTFARTFLVQHTIHSIHLSDLLLVDYNVATSISTASVVAHISAASSFNRWKRS